MPRKTATYGFNLFYHDESVLSAEDIRPGSSYTGTLQPDPTNTLNYNFKLMEDIVRDILNGTLAFTKVRAVQDLEAGRDVIVGRYLVLNPEYGLVLARDRRPSPHVLLDFADVLVHAGADPERSVSLSVNGTGQNDADILNPFKPDNSGRVFSGTAVYPIVYTVSTSGTLFATNLAANARLFLAFSQAPQGLSAVKLEASYDGTTYVLLGYYTQELNRSSLLLDEATFAQPPRAVRITLEGTNSASTNFSLTRLALVHSGTPALEGFYLPRAGGKVFGDIELLENKALRIGDAALSRVANNTLAASGTFSASTFVSTAASGTPPLSVTSTATVANLSADMVDGVHASQFGRVDAATTVSQPWTFNANVNLGNGYTVDGVDVSVFKSAYDAHEHNGTDAPKVKSANVLAKPFDSANFPNNNNTYSYNVQSYLDALQDQINDLVTGSATFNNLLVQNLNFTVGGTFTANGVTLYAGQLSLTGNATAAAFVGPLQGNADTASKLQTARTINLGGALSGSTSFDGSANVSINASLNNGSVTNAHLNVNNTLVPNLNADLLDGYDSTAFPRKAENAAVTGNWSFSNPVSLLGSDVNNWGQRLLELKASNGTINWGIGHNGNPIGGNSGNDFAIWRYDDNGNVLNAPLQISRNFGEFRLDGNLILKNNKAIYLEYTGTEYATAIFQNTDGRFIMAPSDDGGWQWDREFGYDPGPNLWYCETKLRVPGLDSASPIKFWNGNASQEIYVRKTRISASWATNDANDPGDGGLFVNGRAFIQNYSGWNGSPAIALAIGDNDSGLNWGGDGNIQLVANGNLVGFWNQWGFNVNNLVVGGQQAWEKIGPLSVGSTPGSGVSGSGSGSAYAIKTPNKTFQLFTADYGFGYYLGEGTVTVTFYNVPFQPKLSEMCVQVTTKPTGGTFSSADSVWFFQTASIDNNGNGTWNVSIILYRQRVTGNDNHTGFHILITGFHW
jgi:hypothetical protein